MIAVELPKIKKILHDVFAHSELMKLLPRDNDSLLYLFLHVNQWIGEAANISQSSNNGGIYYGYYFNNSRPPAYTDTYEILLDSESGQHKDLDEILTNLIKKYGLTAEKIQNRLIGKYRIAMFMAGNFSEWWKSFAESDFFQDNE